MFDRTFHGMFDGRFCGLSGRVFNGLSVAAQPSPNLTAVLKRWDEGRRLADRFAVSAYVSTQHQ